MLRPASFGAVMAAALAFAGIASAQQLGYNFNFTLPIVADTQSYHSTIYLHDPNLDTLNVSFTYIGATSSATPGTCGGWSARLVRCVLHGPEQHVVRCRFSHRQVPLLTRPTVIRHTTATGILPIRFCHSRGPVSCTDSPFASTATVTGMSSTSNS